MASLFLQNLFELSQSDSQCVRACENFEITMPNSPFENCMVNACCDEEMLQFASPEDKNIHDIAATFDADDREMNLTFEDDKTTSDVSQKTPQDLIVTSGGDCEDHSKCSLQLIDWKTEITSVVKDDHWTGNVRGARPAWQSIEPAVQLVIGLTVSGVIDAVPEDAIGDSHLVIILCSVKSTPEGHWLTTERQLPTIVDSQSVSGDIEVPRHPTGCLVSVGDRCFQLGCSLSVRSASSYGDQSQGGQHQANYNRSQMAHSMSSVELADYAASLVSSQLLMTSLAPIGFVSRDWQPPSRAHIDLLYASFRKATNVSQNVKLFRDFVAKNRRIRSDVSFSISDRELMKTVNAEADEDVGLTDHVIEVLTDLIRNTVDPLDHVVLWLELLSDFARLPFSAVAQSFVRHRTTAVVLGCMTAHARSSSVQQHACHFLSRLVNNWPSDRSPKQQGIKENAIELVTDVMKRYLDDIETVRAAITAMAAVTSYMSRYTENAITLRSESLDGTKRQDVMTAISILDSIQSAAYKTVTDVNTMLGSNDLRIREQADIIISYFSTRSSALSPLLPSTLSYSASPRSVSFLAPLRYRHHHPMMYMTTTGVRVASKPVIDAADDVPDRNLHEVERDSQWNETNDDDEPRQSERIDEMIRNRSRYALVGRVPSQGRRRDNSEGSSPSCERHSTSNAVKIRPMMPKHSVDADDDDEVTEGPMHRRVSKLSSSVGAIIGSPMSFSPLSDHRWLSLHGPRAPDAAPRTRRQGSLKAAVRSLLPSTSSGPKIVRQNSEMGYRSNCRLDDSSPSTTKKLPAASAAAGGRARVLLPVGFRRSISVQSFDVHNDGSRIQDTCTSIATVDLSTDEIVKGLKETSLMTSLNRNPDVTNVDLGQVDGFGHVVPRTDMAPDLIQRQRQNTLCTDDENIKSADDDGSERTPKLIGDGGKGTLRRIVSFSSMPFRPKKDKIFNEF